MTNSELEILVESRLYKTLCEEKGISDTVIGWSTMIINFLKTKAKLEKSLPISRDYITYKKGSHEIYLGNFRVPIQWKYYNFMDMATFNKNRDLLIGKSAFLDRNGLNIIFFSVNNQFSIDSLYDSVAHELLHLFQAKQSKKVFSNAELYRKEDEWKNTDNEFLNDFGHILYLSNRFEQDAFNHGLYVSLISCDTLSDMDEVLRNSNIYGALSDITKRVEKLKNVDNNDIKFKTALLELEKYMSFDKLLKFGEKTIERFNKMLANTYTKAQKDWEKDNIIESKANYINTTEIEKERKKIYNILMEKYDIANKLKFC